MGCASSKRIEATVAGDVYRPAVFDINTIQEPWRTTAEDDSQDDQYDELQKPPPILSPVALEKLNSSLESEEAPPRPWDEVSKALEGIKPTLNTPNPAPPPIAVTAPAPPPQDTREEPMKKIKRKSFSFHTLEELDTKKNELDTKVSSKPKHELRKIESMNELTNLDSVKSGLRKLNPIKGNGSGVGSNPPMGVETEGYKPVRENIFLLRDRMEREKEGKEPGFLRRDPLSDYPELCPPRGADSVVVYTTSLGGVRRTYEDCYKVRSILELHRVVFDERDVSLHGEFLTELKELVGEGVCVPRMFVKGRYIGGVDEVVHLNETGRLRRIWNWVGAERGSGRQGCEGCGGARFVPCLDCGGSCKVVVVVVGGKTQKERCPECNENGLVHCPACL